MQYRRLDKSNLKAPVNSVGAGPISGLVVGLAFETEDAKGQGIAVEGTFSFRVQ